MSQIMFPHGAHAADRFSSSTHPWFLHSSLLLIPQSSFLWRCSQEMNATTHLFLSESGGQSLSGSPLYLWNKRYWNWKVYCNKMGDCMCAWVCVFFSLSLQTIKWQMERIFFSKKYFVSSTTQKTSKPIKFHICEWPYSSSSQSNILYKAEILLLEFFKSFSSILLLSVPLSKLAWRQPCIIFLNMLWPTVFCDQVMWSGSFKSSRTNSLITDLSFC